MNIKYYFRALATNAYGTTWAAATLNFTTLGPPTITISAATLTSPTGSRLNGNITVVGNNNPTVTIYWGTSDGGQTAGNWQNSASPTSPSQPQGVAAFYYDTYNLTTATTYYFSAKAVNDYGTIWPTASLSFTTLIGTGGAAGQNGSNGQNGTNGTNGVGITSITNNGDGTFTIHLSDSTTYTTDNFTGPQGLQGIAGSAGSSGTNGCTWYLSSDAPAAGLGNVGDLCLVSSTGDVYQKTGESTWTWEENLIGPTGLAGSPGDKGDKGDPGSSGIFDWEGIPMSTFLLAALMVGFFILGTWKKSPLILILGGLSGIGLAVTAENHWVAGVGIIFGLIQAGLALQQGAKGRQL